MSLQHLSIDTIAETDLGRLVADGVNESRNLEYKEALVLTTDDQKREFLSDLTALANSDGGDLVFGIRAEKGVAVELLGLRNLVADEMIGRIENLLRDSVQPRLTGVRIRALATTAGQQVLLLRIPRSFSAPHMVRHQGVTRFCGRNSNGKYDLDVHELRSAFLASETLSERLKSFRIERVNQLIAGNPPVPLSGSHLLVFHLLPVIGARADMRVSTASLRALFGANAPRPIAASGWGPRFNFDGLLVTSGGANNMNQAYVQVTRSGFLESVEAGTLQPSVLGNAGAGADKWIPGIVWEQRIIDALRSYLKTFSALSLPPPYVASLGLLNVRGFSMHVGPSRHSIDAHPIERDHLLTDEILIESTDEAPERILRPLFDQIWNACGWHGSINYDAAGTWRQHR